MKKLALLMVLLAPTALVAVFFAPAASADSEVFGTLGNYGRNILGTDVYEVSCPTFYPGSGSLRAKLFYAVLSNPGKILTVQILEHGNASILANAFKISGQNAGNSKVAWLKNGYHNKFRVVVSRSLPLGKVKLPLNHTKYMLHLNCIGSDGHYELTEQYLTQDQ